MNVRNAQTASWPERSTPYNEKMHDALFHQTSEVTSHKSNNIYSDNTSVSALPVQCILYGLHIAHVCLTLTYSCLTLHISPIS